MVKKKHTPTNTQNDPDITWRGIYTLEQREEMIRKAAYDRYEKRGYTHGYDLDDWLAAEDELEHLTRQPQEYSPDKEVQQSSIHGAGMDDKLKHIVKQHPQKAIPQVDSVEPEKAPFKE